MSRKVWIPLVALGLLAIAIGGWVGWQYLHGKDFVNDFPVDRAELSATGRNPYFVLEPGYQLGFESPSGNLIITVLDQIEMVDGVRTRVVEERESENGALIEVSRNYFAINPSTKDVYYFGEDVDGYANGQVVSHDGVWRSGVRGAHFGLMMPGEVHVGVKHYQEVAPGVAQDRAEVVSSTETLSLPAGALSGVLKVAETSPLEPLTTEYKYYAPGIGLVREGPLSLVRYGTSR